MGQCVFIERTTRATEAVGKLCEAIISGILSFFLSLYLYLFLIYLYYFQDVQIHINARKEAEIINPDTMAYLEIDVFLPSLNLGFEYQVLPSLNKNEKEIHLWCIGTTSLYSNRDRSLSVIARGTTTGF